MCGQSLSAILRHRAGICWTVARWTIPACRLLLVLVGDLAVLVGASEIGVRLEWRVGPQDDVVRGQPGLIRSAPLAMAAFHSMVPVKLWRARGRDSQEFGRLTAREQSRHRTSAIHFEVSRLRYCISTRSPLRWMSRIRAGNWAECTA